MDMYNTFQQPIEYKYHVTSEINPFIHYESLTLGNRKKNKLGHF